MAKEDENVLTSSVLNSVATASLQKEIEAELKKEDEDDAAKAAKLLEERKDDL